MSLDFIVPCWCCDEPSVKLCDFIIGWPIGSWEREGKISEDRWRTTIKADPPQPPYTCDRPLCLHCAVRVGEVFLHGEGYHDHDTFDRCPEHSKTEDAHSVPITEHEASVIRARLLIKEVKA